MTTMDGINAMEKRDDARQRDNEQPPVCVVKDARGVLTLTLNRPVVRNAFNRAMVEQLQAHLLAAAQDSTIRLVVLDANGPHFCAGGDIAWMRAILGESESRMREAAQAISGMLQAADALPQPLVAVVGGAAMGGGFGLACCADIVLADESTRLGLGEVRLGIIPSLISPYLVRAIGRRQASQLALTAQSLTADEAAAIGVVSQVCAGAELDAQVARMVTTLLKGAPGAQRRSKRLLRDMRLDEDCAQSANASIEHIVAAWQQPEAAEGMQAFLDKRAPAWGASSM